MDTQLIPSTYVNQYKALSSEKGSIEEKVNLFRSIYQSKQVDLNALYSIWLELFKKDEIPVAWMPGADEKENSNLAALMKKIGLDGYHDLHQWSVKNRGQYWEEVIQRLDIQFSKKYNSVFEGTEEDPVWLADAMMNIVESCFQSAEDQVAIIQGDEKGHVNRVTYSELHKQVNKIAHGLRLLDLAPGEAVVIYMPLTIESIAAYLGIIKAGLVVVSVADSFSASELKKRIESSQAKAIFTCDGYFYGGKRIDILQKVHEADAPLAIVANYTGHSKVRPGDLLYKSLLKDPYPDYYYTTPFSTTNILFSSGTSKEPKAIPWTHTTPIKCAADGYYHLNIKEKDVVCWTTGMGWMMAPWLIYASLINKATIAIFTGAATSDAFGKFVQEQQVTVLGTIPSVVKAWKANNFHANFSWPSIKVFSSTGEPSNQEDYFYLMAMADFNAPIIEYCGGTEIGGGYITGSVLLPASPGTFTSPALGISFYLLNEDKKVANGMPGEVYLVPPSIGLTQKLLNRDHHREYFEGVPPGPNGELLRKHGDAFETIDFLGGKFYKSIGRTDDSMNLGGIKISAIEIEEVVNRHSDINETAAISVPDINGGPERLILFVVLSGDKEIEELKKELQKLLATDLNPLFRISEIILKDNLPRTASNKIMRRELRKEYLEIFS